MSLLIWYLCSSTDSLCLVAAHLPMMMLMCCLLALQTEFVDEYGDYGGRVQDYDDDGNPTDSDLEDSLDDTEQVSTQP